MLQSRVGLRSLGRATAGLYKSRSNVQTCLLSTNSPSDRDQQLEFAHLGTFWKKGTNLLFDAQERARYYSLQKKGILPKDSFWSPVWTYICLENPLLKKYGVTGPDIIDGAKHSYIAVNEALSDQTFYKHLRGEVEKCDSHDFLSSVQAPDVYNAWRASSKQFDDSGMRFSLTSLSVTDVAIRNIVTKIVPGDVQAGTEYMTDFERASWLEANEWLDKVLKEKDGQKEDTLEPPVASSSSDNESVKVVKNVVEPLHNTIPVATPAAPITTPINTSTTTNNTTSNAATATPTSTNSTNASAATSPATVTPTSSPVTPVQASAQVQAPVSTDNFSVQPATRAGRKRIVVPARTKDTTTASTSTAASTTSSTDTNNTSPTSSTTPTSTSTTSYAASTPSSTASSTPSTSTSPALIEKYDEVYHIPPITAEGTPVQVEHHTHSNNDSTTTTTTTTNTSTSTTNDSATEPTTDSNTAEVEEEVPIKTGYARDYELFPPGSVLAYVDVQIKAHEESQIVLGKDKSPEGKEVSIAQTKERDVMWSFRACISGQVPLEWVLVDINGRRAEAFRA